MDIFAWMSAGFGLLAIGYGAIVLRGILRRSLSRKWVVGFLRWSLLASMAGLLPLRHQLSLIQGVCMLLVYCSGVVVLAWRKFRLAGLWRPVFAFFIVVVLYLNVVSVSIRLFEYSPLFAMASTVSDSCFVIAQFYFASVFVVLGELAVRKCHAQQTH